MKAWLAKAEEDVLAASAILGREMPSYDAVGFHAQQAAEKALKALLVRYQVVFGRTHDIGQLLELVEGVAAGFAERHSEVRGLTPFAVITRYPGEIPPLTREEASRWLDAGRRVLDDVRGLLEEYLQGGRADG